MTQMTCHWCAQELWCTEEDRVLAPYFVDMLVDKHLQSCEAFQGHGASYTCGFCGVAVDLPEQLALALFGSMPDQAVEAIRAEQQRHFARCDAYVERAVANGVAAIESTLKEAAR